MAHDQAAAPDSTAVRVALWRALHVLVDPPEWLRLMPVDFEAGESWRERLSAAGFDDGKPTVVDGLRPPDNSEELLVATT